MMAEGRASPRAQSTPQNVCLLASMIASCIFCTVVSEEFPAFLEQPQSQFISQSSMVTLRCSATPESAVIKWLFDGQPLDESRYRALEILGSNLQLLPHAGAEDVSCGEYRCTASTSLGTVISQPALLSRPALSRFTPVDDVSLIVPEGGYVTLTCDPPRSSPSAYVVFQKSNGELVDTSQETVHQLPSGNLVLSNLTSAWAGDFRCVAVNPLSRVNRTSPGATSLIIDRALQGVVGPAAQVMQGMRQKAQVEIGENITLECPSYGHLGAKIIWSKYGGSLPVGRFNLSMFGNLQIQSAQYEDSGTYTCKSATNVKIERHVLLEILTPPVVQVLKNPSAEVQHGSRVEMACSMAGHPQPELQWFHNGRLVSSNNEGQLVLAEVNAADAGIYQCMATNKLGTAYGVMRLEVSQPRTESASTEKSPLVGDDQDVRTLSGNNGLDDHKKKSERRDRKKSGKRKTIKMRDRRKKKKNGHGGHTDKEKPKYAPSVPTVAQLSDRSVMLNWSVPDKGNGQTIKFFKVQYKEMVPEKGPWRTSDAHLTYNMRRFEVSDLKSGGSYKFRILAVYEDDDNKNSANTPIFKLSIQPYAQARAPDTAPTIVEAKPVFFQQNYGIGVKWQYKAESASPIEGFVIFYKPFGASEDKEKMIPGAGIRNDVIRDLQPNTPYNIRMQSFNMVGRSQFSNQVVITTKLRDSSVVQDYPEPEMPLKEPEVNTETPGPGRRSSDTLENPVILGVVLGALLLALLILITMCWWKQRQQKRRSLASGPQKFQDQSQCIFADSNHTKPNGTLYPANGSVPVANGHSTHLEGHKHMNIDINPLAEYDMQTAGQGDGRTKLFYGNGVNGTAPRFAGDNGCSENKFHHTGSNSHHGCNGDIPFMVQQKSLYSIQHCTLPHTANTFYSEAGSMGLSVNHEYSEPGDRQLQLSGVLHSAFKQNIDHHSNGLGQMRNFDYNRSGSYDQQPQVGRSHYSSLERLSPLYSHTHLDYGGETGVCQQHSKHILPPAPTSPTGHSLVSNFGTVPGCLGSGDPNLLTNGRHKRRWKRPHSREHAHTREHAMKDQATNTDLSSNDGTLEYSTYCKSGSSLNSESEIYGPNCDSSFANNGSLESINKDSQSSVSSTSRESDLHISADLPA